MRAFAFKMKTGSWSRTKATDVGIDCPRPTCQSEATLKLSYDLYDYKTECNLSNNEITRTE